MIRMPRLIADLGHAQVGSQSNNISSAYVHVVYWCCGGYFHDAQPYVASSRLLGAIRPHISMTYNRDGRIVTQIYANAT